VAALDILEQEQLPQRVSAYGAVFERGTARSCAGCRMWRISQFWLARRCKLGGSISASRHAPFEVAMRMWERVFNVRYGADTIQLGLRLVIEHAGNR